MTKGSFRANSGKLSMLQTPLNKSIVNIKKKTNYYKDRQTEIIYPNFLALSSIKIKIEGKITNNNYSKINNIQCPPEAKF